MFNVCVKKIKVIGKSLVEWFLSQLKYKVRLWPFISLVLTMIPSIGHRCPIKLIFCKDIKHIETYKMTCSGRHMDGPVMDSLLGHMRGFQLPAMEQSKGKYAALPNTSSFITWLVKTAPVIAFNTYFKLYSQSQPCPSLYIFGEKHKTTTVKFEVRGKLIRGGGVK